ncbi:MAG: MerR family transcriptional regulator [Candidatus Aminicenantes bacterium]|nr:MerR family transcriptional regulator [Acidobacteriota bacterium]MCG2811104.1 MerR family transcriptional regulator [Candidatus Aminicenantes bacterium]
MLSIGEFSLVTQLSIKALRLYHEKGILVPSSVNMRSKYRYYGSQAVERALVLRKLQELGFSLQEIKEIFSGCQDDAQIAVHVQKKLAEIGQTIRKYQGIQKNLRLFLDSVKEEKMIYKTDIESEEIPEVLICSIRFRGKYIEVGAKFGTLFKSAGRRIKGKPFSLYYDGEYKEENADIEACLELKKEIRKPGVSCRRLAGGKALTMLHYGPYEELGHSYQRLYEACRQKGFEVFLPIREQYLKGPGLIFRGNPKKYVTKLIFPVKG